MTYQRDDQRPGADPFTTHAPTPGITNTPWGDPPNGYAPRPVPDDAGGHDGDERGRLAAWRERRREARRQAERVLARQRSGLTPDGRRSLRVLAQAREEEAQSAPHPMRHPTAVLAAGAVGVLGGLFVLASIAKWGDGLLSDADVAYTAVAAVAAVVGFLALRRSWGEASQRSRRLAVAAAVVLAGAFVLGTATQYTLDGRPLFDRSAKAEAAREVEALHRDLESLVPADQLLALPLDQIRVRRDDLDAEIAHLTGIVERWGGRSVESFANPTIAEAARALVQAADVGVGALEAMRDVSLQYDAARHQQATTLRSSLISEALRSGQLLSDGAQEAGVAAVLDAPVRE